MAFTFSGPVPVPSPLKSPLTVLITGASRGIGLELVQQYAEWNAENVVFAGVRNVTSSSALQSFANNHPNVHIIPLDVESEGSIQSSLSKVEALTNHLDILINNAAVATHPDPLKVTSEQFESVFHTNVTGALITIQTYLPLLQRSSDPKVLNVSSGLGSNTLLGRLNKLGFSAFVSYSVSKAALNMLTSVFKYAVPKITFLAVSPGWVATDMGKTGGLEPPTSAKDSVQALRYYSQVKGLDNSGEFFDAMTGDIIPF